MPVLIAGAHSNFNLPVFASPTDSNPPEFNSLTAAVKEPAGNTQENDTAGSESDSHSTESGDGKLKSIAVAAGSAPSTSATTVTKIGTGSNAISTSNSSAANRQTARHNKHRPRVVPAPIFMTHSDPLATEMSPEAVQLADMLSISDKLHRVIALSNDSGLTGSSRPSALREERSDLKFEILETVEETRLQIDFVVAEIDEEEVILEEAMRIFSDDRDKRVNRANQTAFRTNGALWAVAEAFDIPTYNHPKLSIPSGSIGILAGIVPSLFSGYATRSSGGGRYKREIYPNILTKMFDLPTTPRVEFPDVVWQYLNANPVGETRTRRQIMQDHWLDDTNIHVFRDGVNTRKLMLLTGNEPYTADMNLISDKLLMMGQLKAVVLQMSRPLLEICMVSRGQKRFPDRQ